MDTAVPTEPGKFYLVVKDCFDRVLSLVGLILLMPLMASLCILIRLTSMGPVFYRQERVGKGGKFFDILKFRTMSADAESSTGPVWAQERDPRITPVGRFLRLSHLDEIPQLINVLFGEMSLVGPRPERPIFVEQFKRQIPNYAERLNVKPGITGLAQVYLTYDSTLRSVKKKLHYDRIYIKKMCMMTDIIIVVMTVRCLTGRGAR